MVIAQLSDGGLSLIGPLTHGREAGEVDRAPLPAAREEEWERLINDLLHIRRLKQDWDGQGADAPAAGNVDKAIGWVQQMRAYSQAIPPSRALPGIQGEV